MDQPFAMFAWLGVHGVHGHVVDNVEPACERDATTQLGRFHRGAPNVFDPWMVQASPESKPYLGMWSALHNGLRELVNLDRDVVLGD